MEIYISKYNKTLISNSMVQSYSKPILLIGPAGCGKTTLIKKLAHRHGFKWMRMEGSAHTTEHDIIGSNSLREGNVVWEKGPLMDFAENGGVFQIDEINAIRPGALLALNGFLEGRSEIYTKDGEKRMQELSPKFKFFATMNPSSYKYAGTNKMNDAFLDRFTIIEMHYPDPEQESRIIKNYFGYSDEANPKSCKLIDSIVDYFGTARRNGQDFSVRKTIDIFEKMHMFDSIESVLEKEYKDCHLDFLDTRDNPFKIDGKFFNILEVASNERSGVVTVESTEELNNLMLSGTPYHKFTTLGVPNRECFCPYDAKIVAR